MITKRFFAAAAALFLAGAAGAQIPDAGAANFSMADNGLAAARGYNAIQLNPANLGLSSNPGFSLNLLSAGGVTGLKPVKFNDIANYGGKLIPSTVKEQWLQSIGTGGESGMLDGALSVLALSISHLGFQAGVVGTGNMSLNQDAAEAILFGNAGRTGTPRSFAFNGSHMEGSAFGVGAVSLGIPVMTGRHGEQLSFGVTGKYILGIAAARAMDNGSTVTVDSVNVQFPAVYTDSAHIGNSGSGVGVDVGMTWTNGSTTFGATARNVVNSFAWNPKAFRASLASALFTGSTHTAEAKDTLYTAAPAALRNSLEAEKFQPEIAVGLSHQAGSFLLVADGQQRIGDGIDIGPKMHIGVGAEYSGLSILMLRAGAAAITDGFELAGGVGLKLGSFELSAGASQRSHSGGGSDLGLMLSLISIL